MRDLLDLLTRSSALRARGAKALLATLVRVRGSHYRRPGARMLIEGDGELTGILSGGCLEGDLAERGRAVLATGTPTLVRYDLSAAAEALWGFGLGCQGEVEVLLEALDANAADPLAPHREVVASRRPAALATVFACDPADRFPVGSSCLFKDKAKACWVRGGRGCPAVPASLETALACALGEGRSTAVDLELEADDGTVARASLLVEALRPPTRLLLGGTGRDAQPLARQAAALGWEVLVLDPRARAETAARFPEVPRVLAGPPRSALADLAADRWTVAVVMTHAYLDDLALLEALWPLELPYLALLGPAARRERLLADLAARGLAPSATQRAALHGPAGLDLGAESPEEIAFAILAEAQAAIASRPATPLRDRAAANALAEVSEADP